MRFYCKRNKKLSVSGATDVILLSPQSSKQEKYYGIRGLKSVRCKASMEQHILQSAAFLLSPVCTHQRISCERGWWRASL